MKENDDMSEHGIEATRAFRVGGGTTFVVPHADGEEDILVEMIDDRRVSTRWTKAGAADVFRAMGAAEIHEPLPELAIPFVERRLAEERERPSVIMADLVSGMAP